MSPYYDRICKTCGWVAVDVLEPSCIDPPACPACGAPTERVWLTKSSNVIGDETDFVSHNGEKFPVRFRSKADHRRWLTEKGYRIQDDASGHSSTGGKQWLASAEVLATRNGSARGTAEGDDPPLHLTWTGGDLTPAQVAEYRKRNG